MARWRPSGLQAQDRTSVSMLFGGRQDFIESSSNNSTPSGPFMKKRSPNRLLKKRPVTRLYQMSGCPISFMEEVSQAVTEEGERSPMGQVTASKRRPSGLKTKRQTPKSSWILRAA